MLFFTAFSKSKMYHNLHKNIKQHNWFLKLRDVKLKQGYYR